MKKYFSLVIKYILAFIITAAVLLGLLAAAAAIPRDKIRENVKRSAKYFCERDIFEYKAEGQKRSVIDHYADAILLNIAFQYDDKDILKSVMWSSYYRNERQEESKNLLDAVEGDYKANQQYLRYWHGSNAVVRPLLVFFSIKGIYILNAVILLILLAVLVFLLARRGAVQLVVSLAVGLLAVSVWFVPMSLEYTWTFYIMLVMSIVVVLREGRRGSGHEGKHGNIYEGERDSKSNNLGILFMICGMVTCFMDFLTTELLTLLVPLMIVIWFRHHGSPAEAALLEKDGEKYRTLGLKQAAVLTFSWGAGYAFMWLTKWIMAAVVLGENVSGYVKENLEERISGDLGLSFGSYLGGALKNNLGNLLPGAIGNTGKIITIILVFAAFYLCFVYKKEKVNRTAAVLYLIIVFIPLIRYSVLMNHSYLHSFFTFRALLASVMAVFLIICELVDWRAFGHANKKKRRN
ncbi:MAG: hypothetical protein IKQ63_06415 [Eubacterium sp.]|nr:hypothetical protein [Eubacterium sp.]